MPKTKTEELKAKARKIATGAMIVGGLGLGAKHVADVHHDNKIKTEIGKDLDRADKNADNEIKTAQDSASKQIAQINEKYETLLNPIRNKAQRLYDNMKDESVQDYRKAVVDLENTMFTKQEIALIKTSGYDPYMVYEHTLPYDYKKHPEILNQYDWDLMAVSKQELLSLSEQQLLHKLSRGHNGELMVTDGPGEGIADWGVYYSSRISTDLLMKCKKFAEQVDKLYDKYGLEVLTAYVQSDEYFNNYTIAVNDDLLKNKEEVRTIRKLWVRDEMSEQKKAEYDSKNIGCFFYDLVNEPYKAGDYLDFVTDFKYDPAFPQQRKEIRKSNEGGPTAYLDLDNPTVAKHKDEVLNMISEYTRITQQRDKEIAGVESDMDVNKSEIEQSRDTAKKNVKEEKEPGYRLNKNKHMAENGTIDYAQWLRDHPQDR